MRQVSLEILIISCWIIEIDKVKGGRGNEARKLSEFFKGDRFKVAFMHGSLERNYIALEIWKNLRDRVLKQEGYTRL